MLLFTIALLAIVIALIYIFLIWNFDYWHKRGIPGPKPLPLLGNYPSIFTQKRNVAHDLDEIYKAYKKDADFVGIFSSRTPQILILNGQLMRKVLVNDFKYFHDNDASTMIDNNSDFIFANNPFALTGEQWKSRRAEVSNGLTVSRVKSLYPVTKKVCNRLSDYIEKQLRVPSKDGIDGKDLCIRFTSDLVTDAVLGLNAESLSDKPTPILDMTKNLFSQSFFILIYSTLVGLFPPLKKFYKARFIPKPVENFFVDLMRNAIHMRRTHAETEQKDRNDFLTYLLQVQDKKNLSLLDMTAHSMTFLLDGFETSAIVLSHTLLLLGRNMHIQKKLREEILSNINAEGECEFENLIEMPYLDACIHEAIRLFPPGLFSNKICTEATELVNKDGTILKIKKGYVIVLPMYSAMRDEDFYDEPEAFQPERFLEENGGLRKYKEMGAYFGFGDGPRICVGMRFALANVKAGLVEILRNYEVHINPKTRTDNKLDPIYFLSQLDGGIWLDLKPLN